MTEVLNGADGFQQSHGVNCQQLGCDLGCHQIKTAPGMISSTKRDIDPSRDRLWYLGGRGEGEATTITSALWALAEVSVSVVGITEGLTSCSLLRGVLSELVGCAMGKDGVRGCLGVPAWQL